MSFIKQIRELWDHLRGKGPAAAVAVTLDLSEARENKPYYLEAGAVFVERCDGDLYARVNGPNGDGINLRYVKKILYPVTSLYLTNSAQAGKSARLLLLPTGMDADPPTGAAEAPALDRCRLYKSGDTNFTSCSTSTIYFDMEEFDTNDMHTGSQAYVNIKKAGYYLCVGVVIFNANANGTRQCGMYKNDIVFLTQQAMPVCSATVYAIIYLVYCGYFEAGDTIKMTAHQGSGVTLALMGGYPYMTSLMVTQLP